ncbi:MAG TPA: hypothetical protein VGN98_07010 [Tianweitania sediminis]|jgi:hypothetical protein|nr:hypothetical protein [Tianweitania sediminis]
MPSFRKMLGLREQRPPIDLSPSPERQQRRAETERLIEEYRQRNDVEQERLIAQARSETRYYNALASAMEILK